MIKSSKNLKRVVIPQNKYNLKPFKLSEHINKILVNESHTNPSLDYILYELQEKLYENNTPEVLLVDNFLSSMDNFKHINSVNKAITAINENIKRSKVSEAKYQVKKTLETMKTTNSKYLVPTVESFIQKWLETSSPESSDFIIKSLINFSYDPYVNEIILTIRNLDNSSNDLGKINESITVLMPKVYSPILAISENVSAFNIKGNYFLKKGNTIEKVDENYISQYNSNFIVLCNVLNDHRVEVNEHCVDILHEGGVGRVTESNELFIDQKQMNNFTYNKLYEAARLVDRNKANLLEMMSVISENISKIASINFVKRIEKLNEGSVDIFKNGKRIDLHFTDNFGHSTFFKNVNPIQARTSILERMDYDIAADETFKETAVDDDMALKNIISVKKAYTDQIDEIQAEIERLQAEPYHPEIEEQIDVLMDELEYVKSEYLKYTERVDDITNINEDLTITINNSEEDKSYTVVIPTEDTKKPKKEEDEDEEKEEDKKDEEKDNEKTEENEEADIDDDFNDIDFNDIDLGLEEEGTESGEEQEHQNESVQYSKSKNLNEKLDYVKDTPIGVGETVKVKNIERPVQVLSVMGNRAVVSNEGFTVVVNLSEIKRINKPVTETPLQKFNDNTLSLEESVDCGIFVDGFPVKTSGCIVNINEYTKTPADQNVKVLVEGIEVVFPKSNVNIL